MQISVKFFIFVCLAVKITKKGMLIKMADYKLNIIISDRAKKSITFRIVSPDTVEVTVPRGTSNDYILSLAEKKRGVIEKKLLEYGYFMRKNVCFELTYGSYTYLFGIRFGIYSEGDIFSAPDISALSGTFAEKLLRVPVSSVAGRFDCGFVIASDLFGEQIEKALESVYIALAKRYLPVRMSEIASELGTECPPVKITSAKKQWGSCIHDKRHSNVRICFSWRVMLASVYAIDSVIVHELCHISEPNHGERFWRHVKNYMPDYSNAAEELRRISGVIASCWHI